jgi:hypothetical protein
MVPMTAFMLGLGCAHLNTVEGHCAQGGKAIDFARNKHLTSVSSVLLEVE